MRKLSSIFKRVCRLGLAAFRILTFAGAIGLAFKLLSLVVLPLVPYFQSLVEKSGPEAGWAKILACLVLAGGATLALALGSGLGMNINKCLEGESDQY